MTTACIKTRALPLPAILALEFTSGDLSQTITVQGYLLALLAQLWEEEEGFSGKRPFGNSGWKYDVYGALVKAGVVTGVLDADGYVDTCDHDAADTVIRACIHSLSSTP